jgi:hypothetical protein
MPLVTCHVVIFVDATFPTTDLLTSIKAVTSGLYRWVSIYCFAGLKPIVPDLFTADAPHLVLEKARSSKWRIFGADPDAISTSRKVPHWPRKGLVVCCCVWSSFVTPILPFRKLFPSTRHFLLTLYRTEMNSIQEVASMESGFCSMNARQWVLKSTGWLFGHDIYRWKN